MYLQSLTERLADGLARLPEDACEPHVRFLQQCQNADGGFSGREGDSDLYYTAFGLRSLSVLGVLTPEIAARAVPFLRRSLTQQASVVDFFSLLYACLLVQASGGPDVLADSAADWPDRVAAALESLRTSDGGYAKSAGSASGSTYHTFLVGLCYQMLGRPLPDPENVTRFILSRRREDGGFVEIAPMRRSGTNPTAAAVGVLQLLDSTGTEAARLTSAIITGVTDLIAGMPSDEGGLRANGRAPLADLLSTFTGLWTLDQLGARQRINTRAVLEYARALALPTGGFRGGLWDDRTDVEYTFYGLGVLGILS
ncbi:MAG: geranyl transferase [Gemmataceae bacterium]|nr:geranyl transferase [Gemmataceae bacterium]